MGEFEEWIVSNSVQLGAACVPNWHFVCSGLHKQ